MAEPMISYAQNFEDVLLARAFSRQASGVYVDIGASHPEELSVTKHFHDRGWRGANVEPIPRLHELFVATRPGDLNLNVAVGAHTGARPFFECIGFDAFSTFDRQQAEYLAAHGHDLRSYLVETITANEVFERLGAGEVDFLKVDVEGAEREVLESLDLNKYRPRVLVIEAMAPGRPFPGWWNLDSVANWKEWEPRVLAARYRFAYFDGISRFYVREESADLLAAFSLPVGVFDGFLRPVEAKLKDELALCHAQAVRGREESLEQIALLQRRIDEAAREAGLLRDRIAESERSREELTLRIAMAEGRNLYGRVQDLWRYIVKCLRDVAERWIAGLARGGRHPAPPRITLVTPAMNAAAHIAETLESVLTQDYPDLQYIVVDGGSTDGTLDIVRSYMDREGFRQRIALLITEPDAGMYDAVAKGFAHGDGEVLGYLNADDLLEPGALARVGACFARRPGVHAVHHEDTVLYDGWKFPNARQPDRVTTADLLRGHILFQDGVFFRRHLYLLVGGLRRDLRFAGDFDLWLRMSTRAHFMRMPPHVSCFRIRQGQLSNDMASYRREMDGAIRDLLGKTRPSTRLRWAIIGAWNRLRRRVRRLAGRDRLFFPLDWANLPPPPANAPPQSVAPGPCSPIDRQPAERLLFSSIDTRFGIRDLNYVYLDSRHGIAITYPPVGPASLQALYERHYSSPESETVVDSRKSPYRGFNGKMLWHRALLRVPVELLQRFIFRPDWQDKTLRELCEVLRGAHVDPSRKLRFLDTGCFEGKLLDQIRDSTPWVAAGLEPNARAVEVARAKGHDVTFGHAEDALDVLPGGRQFDVVFMGQSIEHVIDPAKVLRRLRMLLAPGGVVVVSTPNLDSHQIDWFGPTWAHWHPPYHRYIFSRRGLIELARHAGLRARLFRTFSHCYWTAMSIVQNRRGLGVPVSHAESFDYRTCMLAQRIDFWAALWWNRLGKGDYSFMVMAEDIE